MRAVGILHDFPYVILLSLPLGGSNVALFAAIVFTLWLTPVVRAQARSLARKDFVEAVRAGGLTGSRIVLEPIVPNCMSVGIVYGSFLVPEAMVPEVILSKLFRSFLGIKEPQASWGNLILAGSSAMYSGLRLLLLPGALLVVVLLGLNFIVDGLRDAFDSNGRLAASVAAGLDRPLQPACGGNGSGGQRVAGHWPG